MAYTSRNGGRSRSRSTARPAAARRRSASKRAPARRAMSAAPQTLRLVIEQTGAGVVARSDQSYPFAPVQRAGGPTRAKR